MKLLIRMLCLALAVLAVIPAEGATAARVRGVVRDSLTHAPVPYAAVLLEGPGLGVLTDEEGKFSLVTSRSYSGITASAMGYESTTVAPPAHPTDEVVILLPSTGVELSEVTVKPGKEHYSKKNNPAVELMERIRRNRDKGDPRLNHDFYNYGKYERITLALDNFNSVAAGDTAGHNALAGKFPLLKEYMDTSVLTGDPILNISVREKASHINYRRDPRAEKEFVSGLRGDGIDGMLDPEAVRTLYEDVLREVDIYGNDITLMQNRFVSPLSRLAPDFYKFYITDTIRSATDSTVVLSFAPHNPRVMGFTGRLWVALGDTTMFIHRVELNTPAAINLNFIKQLKVVQEFDRAADGTRLKTLDDMVVRAGVLSSGSQLYARRVTAFAGHSFLAPPDPSVFKHRGREIISANAERRSDDFWQHNRLMGISRAENSVGDMLARLRQSKFFYWSEQVIKTLVTGYITTGNPSRWDFGPVNTTISYNDLEGVRLRLGGMSTAALSPHWFTRDYVAYGLKDHRWKYLTEWEYSFNEKRRHSREFPVHSLRATHLYDVDMLGQHYLFTNADNVFVSLRRLTDNFMTYHRVTSLQYTLELENNFSVVATVKHERQEASPYVTFVDGFGTSHSHYNETSLGITLRWAPGEKFYQTRTMRLPVNLDAPVFQLSHVWAPRGTLGNTFAVSVTEASFQKRFWFSTWGYTDVILKGGHVWSRSPFPNLLIPNANVSYTIQPESFALMNPMEFINDSYASWDVTYWANGAILNYVPWVNHLKLREVFSFRGVWGHLSDRNNPRVNPDLYAFPEVCHTTEMTSTPYMEVGVGLDNIFRILRVDYCWRLSYRNTPVPDAPNSGLRIALHFTF